MVTSLHHTLYIDIHVITLHVSSGSPAACALVCRSWLQHSRFLQFDSAWGSAGICLDLHHQPQALPELASLLRSPFCTISPHVRKLGLVSLSYGSRSDLMQLTTLKDLTHITLGDVGSNNKKSGWANGIQPKVILAFLACFEQIRSLDLSRFVFSSFEDLRCIICSCPRLHSLELWHIDGMERSTNGRLAHGSTSIIM